MFVDSGVNVLKIFVSGVPDPLLKFFEVVDAAHLLKIGRHGHSRKRTRAGSRGRDKVAKRSADNVS